MTRANRASDEERYGETNKREGTPECGRSSREGCDCQGCESSNKPYPNAETDGDLVSERQNAKSGRQKRTEHRPAADDNARQDERINSDPLEGAGRPIAELVESKLVGRQDGRRQRRQCG